MQFGEQVRALREARKLTQRELADRLGVKAFHEATLNFLSVVDEKLTDTIDLTIEGAITRYPPFRAMMLRMLEREFQIPCSDAEVRVFWLASPPSTIHEYIQKRGCVKTLGE